jgi:large subunit ribosomal protein L18
MMNPKLLRKRRVRAKITGTSDVPRLSVHTTLTHIYAQIIDDKSQKTICAASDLKIKDKGTKTEIAKKVGAEIAAAAQKAGIKKVVFDRGSKLYHGRVKALAEEAREKGLHF